MEYILVTTFTLATTLAALGYLKRVLKERFAELEEAGRTTEFDESLWRP